MAVSKQEQKIFDAISKYYDRTIVQSYRPNFLKNSTTGNNLEIDIFIPALGIGFEFQGAVHFNNLKQYNNDSDKSRARDLQKYDLMDIQYAKIAVVEIFETDLKGNIIDNVILRCNNMIDYYFEKKHFSKCESIERFIQIVSNDYNKIPVTWFKMCNKIQYYKIYKYTNRTFPIKNLIGFYFVHSDKLTKRKAYDIKYVSKLLDFESHLIERKRQTNTKVLLLSK